MTSSTDAATSATRAPIVTAIGVLAVLGVVGSIVMVVAHIALDLPLVAALFVVGALLFAVVAYGVFRRTSWAWPAALVVNGLGFASAVMPWRGLRNSGLPALVTLVALGLLLTPAARSAMLRRGDGGARG